MPGQRRGSHIYLDATTDIGAGHPYQDVVSMLLLLQDMMRLLSENSGQCQSYA